MNERKDEQWLDEELRRLINTTRPEFDAQSWKRKFPQAHAALGARQRQPSDEGGRRGHRIRLMVRALAAAAVLLVTVALLVVPTPPQERPEKVAKVRAQAPSPARIVSMASLRIAYRQGGEEALNQQLDKSLEVLGPRPGSLSPRQMLDDLEG